MKIVVHGLTITSSWGNGHATTYRSLLKALADRGHIIHFIEKDAEWYRSNRDLPSPAYCAVHLYEDWEAEWAKLIAISADADVVVVGSYFPDAIVATQLLLTHGRCPILFYDIDTPITLGRLRRWGRTDYLEAELIPAYAAYLSFTSGPVLRELEESFGAKRAMPLFCSVDPDLYRPSSSTSKFDCDFSYLGTYAVDRQAKLMRLVNDSARLLPQSKFIVAGSQYPPEIEWEENVQRLLHVPPTDHPVFYSSCRFTLNLTRDNMVAAGYSPSVRLFEASACGAAIISDQWPGLSDFLKPGEEILIADSASEVVEILTHVSDETRRRIGQRARERILSEHTAEHRAAQFEEIVAYCTASGGPMAAARSMNADRGLAARTEVLQS